MEDDKVADAVKTAVQLGYRHVDTAQAYGKENASVDFVISDEDMEILKRLEKIKDYGEFGFFPVFGGKL